jgi:hypothetical protein
VVNVLVRLRLIAGTDPKRYEWVVHEESNRHELDAEQVRKMIAELRSKSPRLVLPGCVLEGVAPVTRHRIAEYLELVISDDLS